ncbi:MAG: GNAT family N-acetyltransferase [Micavibrio sp.]
MKGAVVRKPDYVENAAANQNRAPSPWKTTIHKNYAGLELLWRRLEAEGLCTVFQTYDWAACWYDTAASCGEAEPLIAVVFNENIGMVWIMPLCLYRRKGLRIISFADLGITDYAAPLMARGAPSDPETVQAMMRSVFKVLPPCDIINFQKLVEKVEGVPNPLLLLPGIERFPVGSHGIRLGEPWPALKKKIVQSRMRSHIRHREKLIREEGEVVIEHHVSPEMFRPLMDRIITLRNKRFLEIGKPAMPPLWQNFYKNLASRKSRALNIIISTMTVAGETVATCFGLARGKTYYAIMPTFEMGKWERFAPGTMLYDAMLTNFSEQTGEGGYFDFTVGDEPYKKRFGGERHLLFEWMMPRSAVGLIAYMVWRTKVALRYHPRFLEILKKVANRFSFKTAM